MIGPVTGPDADQGTGQGLPRARTAARGAIVDTGTNRWHGSCHSPRPEKRAVVVDMKLKGVRYEPQAT